MRAVAILAGTVAGTVTGLLVYSVLGKQPAAKDPAADQQDPPTSVAEEIRAQLDERDRKAAADKAAADGDAWRKGVDEKLAGMVYWFEVVMLHVH